MAQSLLSGDVEWALYECGALLYIRNTDAFEDALIEAIGIVGESIMPGQGTSGLWQNCAKDVLELVAGNSYSVKQAFIVIAKVCLLCKRVSAGGTNGRAQLPRLRDKILTEFPTDAILNGADLVKYRAIIPAVACPERDFAIRILAGFTRQLFERRYRDLRDSLEYLSRKKNVFSLPTLDGWPAPSRAEADKGDFVWFLWAILLIYQPLANPFLELFRANYNNKKRDRRLGLLWGAASLTHPEPPGAFDTADLSIIKHVEDTSGILWGKLKKEMPESAAPQQQKRPVDTRGLEIMDKWEPRVAAAGNTARNVTTTAPIIGPARGVNISISSRNIKRNGNETSDSHSRVRGVHFDAETYCPRGTARVANYVDPQKSLDPILDDSMESRYETKTKKTSRYIKNYWDSPESY